MVDGDDLAIVLNRLRPLEGLRGKIRVTDALLLAGFPERSHYRAQLVGKAMRQLGWERARYWFDGVLEYAYAKGSRLDREAVLFVEAEDGRLDVKRRES